MQLLRGALKDYPWGRINGLAQWAPGPTEGPQAELWFGVHPAARSPLLDSTGDTTGQYLDDVVEMESAPVLVKLLAAAEPLSVQIHPVVEVARAQWDAQRAGAEQVYADPFEKSEVMLALEPFRAFAGCAPRIKCAPCSPASRAPMQCAQLPTIGLLRCVRCSIWTAT